MKSIRARFMRSYLGAILAVFALSSAIAVYYVHCSIEYYAGRSLCFLAEEKAYEINSRLEMLERSVCALSDYILSEVDEERLRSDAQYAGTFMRGVAERALLLAKTVGQAKTVYFAPDIDTYRNAGCVYLLNAGIDYAADTSMGDFIERSFDVGRYNKTDRGNVAWYYEPQETGEAMWLGPYMNLNLEDAKNTISYVVPMYMDGRFFGVVGMDITEVLFRYVIDNMDYEAGFGFLVGKSGNLIYHKDFPNGLAVSDFAYYKDAVSLVQFFAEEYIDTGRNYSYRWLGVRQRLVLSRMHNGMLLAVSVPESELLRLQSQMLFRMSLLLAAILLAAVFLANNLASRIILPMQTLTAAASRIAHGELNAPVTFRSDNELGMLADAIRKIAVELREYIAYISAQAYTDSMTGTRNKSAYIDKVREIDRRIGENMAEFTVYVFDVNGLKRMNDTLGHEFGDMLIKDAARILRSVFPEDCVYRTGGDEFVAIDEQSDSARTEAVFAAFDARLSAFNAENDQYKVELAVSKGAARFDELRDTDYRTVFARADEAMYTCKEEYYRRHEEQRRH